MIICINPRLLITQTTSAMRKYIAQNLRVLQGFAARAATKPANADVIMVIPKNRPTAKADTCPYIVLKRADSAIHQMKPMAKARR